MTSCCWCWMRPATARHARHERMIIARLFQRIFIITHSTTIFDDVTYTVRTTRSWNSTPQRPVKCVASTLFMFNTDEYRYLIHDLLFLPISTIESRVSERVVTHSCGLFTLEWTHTSSRLVLIDESVNKLQLQRS